MDFNPVISFRGTHNLNNTNLLDNYLNMRSKAEEKPATDKIRINRDFIAELKYNKEKAAIGTVVDGYINGRPAAFKTVTNNEEEAWYEGVINKTYVMIHCNGKNYDGKYGENDFQISIDYNKPSKLSQFINQNVMGKIFMPDYFTIKGNIGDKIVDITLPNAKIPEDIETRDLITMILEDNGLKAQTINGEVKSLKFSSSAVKNIKQKAERRKETINNDIKPIIMQGISSATGLIVGSVISAMLLKFGIKH